jgi:predicted MFS family arabinose efflux permease
MQAGHHAQSAGAAAFRTLVIGLIGFLTLVDLFATQAILPTLAQHYHVMPATVGIAVNASTIGMAISGLVVGLLSRNLNRRKGIWISLALLAIPTTLLANAPDIQTFFAIRVVQGLFMASAFTLTIAYLAEQCTAEAASGALAAYVTGGVASNLFGRLVAGFVADSFGIATNFYVFAALNLAGALLVFFSLRNTTPMDVAEPRAGSPFASWGLHLRNGSLRSCFGIGFLILFAFIGTFTYVNFVLARMPLSLSPMSLGLVYFVFLPSMFTTPLAGRVVQRFGARLTFWASLAVAGIGLPLLLVPSLIPVLIGLVLVGVGTFFAQATATGFVGRAATSDRTAASGLYLASYYLGGLLGAAIIGQIFDRFGWGVSIAGIGVSLVLAALLAGTLKMRPEIAPMQTSAVADPLRRAMQ